MASRRRSKAKPDPDADEDVSHLPVIYIADDDDDEEVGNEDLTLEIVAKAKRLEAKRKSSSSNPEFITLLSSSGDDEADVAAEKKEEEEDVRRTRSLKKTKAKKKKKGKVKKQVEEEMVVLPQIDGTEEKNEKDFNFEEEQIGSTESVLTQEMNGASDNVVLRKLLRGPRYFNPGESISETCFNCGEEGHFAVNCTMEKRKKPCFVCGLFGHNAKQCMQGQDCYICNKRGHIAKACPDKYKKKNSQNPMICLQCGEKGHDMFTCGNGYPSDDMKEITCYICKQRGHLCCSNFTDDFSKEVSCYNCAQLGHTGLGCAKPRGESTALESPTVCYKCHEEGHFARGCTKNKKYVRKNGESSIPLLKKSKRNIDSPGFRSAPHDNGKSSKNKSHPFEERADIRPVKSRVRGGWIVDDDLGDLPPKKYRSNGWASSSTPKGPYVNHYVSSDGIYSSPKASNKQKSAYASPSSNFSSGSRSHGFSSSRFAKSHHRSGRS